MRDLADLETHIPPLDCCCDGRELNFCRNCVLFKHQQCTDSEHNLQWGVLPISLPGFLPQRLLENAAPYDGHFGPSQRVADNMAAAWREETDAPPRIFRAVARWQEMKRDIEAISAARTAGMLRVQISGQFNTSNRYPLYSRDLTTG